MLYYLYVLIFYCYHKKYYKNLKTAPVYNISQFCWSNSGRSRALSWMSYEQPHWVKSSCQLGWALICRLWGMPTSKLIHTVVRIQGLSLIESRSPFSCLCHPGPVCDPKDCFHTFSCFPCGTLWQVDTISRFTSLASSAAPLSRWLMLLEWTPWGKSTIALL